VTDELTFRFIDQLRNCIITHANSSISLFEALQKIKEDLKEQLEDLKKLLLEFTTPSTYPFWKKCEPFTHPSTTTFTLLFAVGLFLLIYKEVKEDPLKISGVALMLFCLALLSKNLIKKVDRVEEKVLGLIDSGNDLLLETKEVARTVKQSVTQLTDTTQEVIGTTLVEFIQELKGTTERVTVELEGLIGEGKKGLIQLRGDSKSVAETLDKGIRDGKFTPTAHVNVDVDARTQQVAGFSLMNCTIQ